MCGDETPRRDDVRRAPRSARIAARDESVLHLTSTVMGPFGATELIVVLVIVLLLFGANKIPQLMTGLGTGIKNFKKGLKDDDDGPRPRLPEKTDDKVA